MRSSAPSGVDITNNQAKILEWPIKLQRELMHPRVEEEERTHTADEIGLNYAAASPQKRH